MEAPPSRPAGKEVPSRGDHRADGRESRVSGKEEGRGGRGSGGKGPEEDRSRKTEAEPQRPAKPSRKERGSEPGRGRAEAADKAASKAVRPDTRERDGGKGHPSDAGDKRDRSKKALGTITDKVRKDVDSKEPAVKAPAAKGPGTETRPVLVDNGHKAADAAVAAALGGAGKKKVRQGYGVYVPGRMRQTAGSGPSANGEGAAGRGKGAPGG